jgi:hypothetical protein
MQVVIVVLRDRYLIAVCSGLGNSGEIDLVRIGESRRATERVNRLEQLEIASGIIGKLLEWLEVSGPDSMQLR